MFLRKFTENTLDESKQSMQKTSRIDHLTTFILLWLMSIRTEVAFCAGILYRIPLKFVNAMLAIL